MRENVQRRIVVQSNVAGRDLRSVVNDIQARVGQNVRLPQGYHVEYGGQFESEAQASRQLLWLSLGVVVAIFFILSAAFGSSRDGLLIMLNLPLALIGGVRRRVPRRRCPVGRVDRRLHHALRHRDAERHHARVAHPAPAGAGRRHGLPNGGHPWSDRAARADSDDRAGGGSGAVPIALSAGEPGSEIQAPMAMVIMFGLLSSTALNMIVVPILYERFGHVATKI